MINGVRRKLNAMEEKSAGWSVLLVDDSTMHDMAIRKIVIMAQGVERQKVYLASCAPLLRTFLPYPAGCAGGSSSSRAGTYLRN